MRISCILYIFLFSIGLSKSDNGPSLTSLKWVSEGSPKDEVWFQDWSGYIRLFITTFSDTSLVDPGPYVTETKNKPYLNPRAYYLVQKKQLIGNIKWDAEFLWNGEKNSFTWEVDRANPKIKLPKLLKGFAIYNNGQLLLEIEEDSQTIFSMFLSPVSYY